MTRDWQQAGPRSSRPRGLGSESAGGVQKPDYVAFTNLYLVAGSPHSSTHPAELTTYMKQLTGQANLTDAQALAAFRALPDLQKLPFGLPGSIS